MSFAGLERRDRLWGFEGLGLGLLEWRTACRGPGDLFSKVEGGRWPLVAGYLEHSPQPQLLDSASRLRIGPGASSFEESAA